jgi:S-adenosylmethionine:tRNA ribosyltransferase-isomerase
VRTSDFDYELPRELIAQHPSRRRDESRLLVVPQGGAPFEHRLFHDLPEYLAAGDLLVLNETEVVPARFLGSKRGTGGRVEMFLLEEKAPARWEVLVRPAARVRAGAVLEFGGGRITAHVVGERPGGRREVELLFEGDPDRLLEELGRVPLRPTGSATRPSTHAFAERSRRQRRACTSPRGSWRRSRRRA